MRTLIVFLFLAKYFTPTVLGDHYDITTMHKFNTEESYQDGEVIRRYLNTCSVTVHLQTNAIDLPYTNMNDEQQGTIYPIKSSTIPPLSFPFENSEWKTIGSSGTLENIQNTSSLLDYQTLIDFNQTLVDFINKETLFGFLKNSNIVSPVKRIDVQKGFEEHVIFNISDMMHLKTETNKFLSLHFGKEDDSFIYLSLKTSNNYLFRICIYPSVYELDKKTKSLYRLMSVSIADSKSNNGTIEYKTIYLHMDEKNQILIYISLERNIKIYDAVGQKIYSYGKNEFIVSEITALTTKASIIFLMTLFQLPQKLPKSTLVDEISIVSPWRDIKNSSTLMITYLRKSNAQLVTSLKEQSTGESIQLESEDLIKLSSNQSGVDETVVARVNVIFPENWTHEKLIHIRADKNVYISNIWEGGNLNLYRIHDSKICFKYNMKDIYKIALQDTTPIKVVSNCLNGGVLDQLGNCGCPPGFTGDSCEIFCGRNHFGQKCSKLCSVTETECKGIILCTPSYGCACAPGYYGEQCLDECEEGTYGADCRQKCGQCQGGCDRYNGNCGECDSPHLIWPSCNNLYSYYKEFPEIIDSNYNSIKLSLNFTLNNIMKSFDETKFYLVQYKGDSEASWRSSSYEPFNPLSTEYLVHNLNPGKKYLFRILLVDKRLRTNNPKYSKIAVGTTQCSPLIINNTTMNVANVTNSSIALVWDKESTIVDNQCPILCYTLEVNDLTDGIVERRKILNIIGNKIVVKFLTPNHTYDLTLRKQTVYGESSPVSTIRVTTDTTTDLSMSVAGVIIKTKGSEIYLQWFKNQLFETYYIKYKLIRQFSCSQEEIKSPLQVVTTTALDYTLNLESNAQYEIFVTIDPSQQTSAYKFTEITDSTLPNIAPNLLKDKFRATDESAQVFWTNPNANCKLINGFFKKFAIELLDLQNTTLNTYETLDEKLDITGLRPKTDYKLRIRYVNHIGHNPYIYDEHMFTTKATPFLSVQDLTAFKASANLIAIRWIIADSNSNITGVHVNVRNQDDKAVSLMITDLTVLKCKAWSSYVCYTVQHLDPNTKYTITVDLFSEEFSQGGSQKSIEAVTRETAPSSVTDIKVEDISNSNMTISWRIPFLLNGILRKFLIEVEHLSSFDEALCCQTVATITQEVNEEQEIYFQALENIQSASSYQVTIRAFTKRLGQETSKIIDTAPPLIPIRRIPRVQVDGNEIEWPKQTGTDVSAGKDMIHMITDLLVIVESTESNTTTEEPSLLRTELGSYLASSWWLAHVCGVNEDCSVNIGKGKVMSDGQYGKVLNHPLPAGHNYTVVVAQVNRYLSARSYTIVRSAQIEL